MTVTLTSNNRPIRLDAYLPEATFLPTGNPTQRHPAILLLHGSGGNTGFWLDRIAPFLSSRGIALFAVHYFDSTQTTRADLTHLTDGVHVPLWLQTVRDTLRHIAAHPQVDAARIALVGVSLGAFLALALGTDSAQPIRAIVDISGGLVAPWDTHATPAFPPTLILHGDADTVVPVTHARTLDTLLTRLNVPHTTHILPREGHWFSPAAGIQILGAITQFLSTHL